MTNKLSYAELLKRRRLEENEKAKQTKELWDKRARDSWEHVYQHIKNRADKEMRLALFESDLFYKNIVECEFQINDLVKPIFYEFQNYTNKSVVFIHTLTGDTYNKLTEYDEHQAFKNSIRDLQNALEYDLGLSVKISGKTVILGFKGDFDENES